MVIDILFVLLSSIFWGGCIISISKIRPPEIAKNYTHFIHALIYVIYYKNITDTTYLISLSTGFYIFDLFYILYGLIIKNSRYGEQIPFIIHHCIAIYGLYLGKIGYFADIVLYMYYLLEYSNFLLYISYHVHKRYPMYKYLVVSVEFLQYIWYSYFRIVRFSKFIYDKRLLIFSTPIYIIIPLMTLYLMGCIWSYKLFRKNLKNLRVIPTDNLVSSEKKSD
jgi:hypothetical protein